MVVAYLGHENGVSKKSGQNYTILHYTYSSARVHGLAADKVFLMQDSGLKLPEGIGEGEALELEFDRRGYLVGLDRA